MWGSLRLAPIMLHSEFCAVWFSLSDVPGKRILLINIHIEWVPATYHSKFQPRSVSHRGVVRRAHRRHRLVLQTIFI